MIDIALGMICCDGRFCSPRNNILFVSGKTLDITDIPMMEHRIVALYGWHVRDGSHFCSDRCAKVADAMPFMRRKESV
jgi:hypothetical protein